MTIGFLFWLLFVLAIIFGFYAYWPEQPGPRGYRVLGGNLLVFVLLFLLGWKVFGFILRG